MNNPNRYYLVTGAAGFLGSHVCSQLLEAGCRVRALVLPNDPAVRFVPQQAEVVLDAVHVMGLKACVVHPSGILGPNDHALGETTRTLLQIIRGEMPLGIQGSFNLCDVRDLAAGTIAAVDKGRIGQCYILANQPVTLKQLCDMLHKTCHSKSIPFYLPLGLADKLAKGLEKQARLTGKKPLMTTFSVYNLARNNDFDDTKARQELGYTTRPYQQTIHDEVQWMQQEGLLDIPKATQPEQRPFSDADNVAAFQKYRQDSAQALDALETGAAAAYHKIEDGVVGTYKHIEQGAVSAYQSIEQQFVTHFLNHDDPTKDQQS